MSLRIEPHSEPIAGYKLISRLGGGGFGEVWKAEAPGGLQKAIKIIHGDLSANNAESIRHAEQELRALKRVQGIRHPYLLSLERYDIVEGRLIIVMELADCNLWDRFRDYRAKNQIGIPKQELLRYMQETAEVLDLMNNEYQLQHLDIKPQNIFLIYNHVKVADFGLVKDLEGMRATVTGGVTPVYAAPETFDGVVTRFCDQYSLAIVYQELLTGQRPFNGTSMQQLLMQHLQGTPNLNPVSPAERPVLMRALAKKPEDRFPSCMAMVQALIQANGGDVAPTPSSTSASVPTPGPKFSLSPSLNEPKAETSFPTGPTIRPTSGIGLVTREQLNAMPAPMDTAPTQLGKPGDPPSKSIADFDLPMPVRIAPPEQKGDGSLVPALIIGLGESGLRVLRRFRQMIADRFGNFEKVPVLKEIYIDTDAETLQSATTARTSGGSFTTDEVIAARLNRAGHYLKPRRNGRSLIEGWLDGQALYKIPRNAVTLGIRAFGRLAFCDHFRTIAQKIRNDLEAITHPDAMGISDRNTRLGLRSNRPRVYIVANVGGGTGSGMFIDAAYTARHKLKQLGYENPEIVGILILPALDRSSNKTQAMANTFAAMTELNHFSKPDTTFSFSYDDRDSNVNDPLPPFTRVIVLPPPPPATASGGAADPFQKAASLLRRELTTPFGCAADQAHQRQNQATPASEAQVTTVATFGEASFSWPKQTILTKAACALGQRLLDNWLIGDVHKFRDVVARMVKETWEREEFHQEAIIAALHKVCEQHLGQSPETLFNLEAEPFVPKGWWRRDPDPVKLWQAVDRLQQIVGYPEDGKPQRVIGKLEYLLAEAGEMITRQLSERIGRLPAELLEKPDFRVIAAEAAIALMRELIDTVLRQFEPLCRELGLKAIEAYIVLSRAIEPEKGQAKPKPADVAESLKCYPKWRYQSLVLRQVCGVYHVLKGSLADQSREITFCRQRLEEIGERLKLDAAQATTEPDAKLLPPGCLSIDHAVSQLLEKLTPEDLRTIDCKLQTQIEQAFAGLFSVCTKSINLISDLQALMLEQTRNLLSTRLGEVNIVDMFVEKYRQTSAAVQAVQQAYNEALPSLLRAGAYRGPELCILGVPSGEDGEAFHPVARQALPRVDPVLAVSTDEILIYREYSKLPLSLLPQLGPLAVDAYKQQFGPNLISPHTRSDIPRWADLEDE